MLRVYFTYVHFVSSIILSLFVHLFQHMTVHQAHSLFKCRAKFNSELDCDCSNTKLNLKVDSFMLNLPECKTK